MGLHPDYFKNQFNEVTNMTTLTKLYEQERKLRILEYKILRHFGGYRNQNGNVFQTPPSLSPWDIEELDFYGHIQQELKVILNKIEEKKNENIEELLQNGTPENPYDVLQVLHARFDYKGKSQAKLAELKKEARKLFTKYDENINYDQFKY